MRGHSTEKHMHSTWWMFYVHLFSGDSYETQNKNITFRERGVQRKRVVTCNGVLHLHGKKPKLVYTQRGHHECYICHLQKNALSVSSTKTHQHIQHTHHQKEWMFFCYIHWMRFCLENMLKNIIHRSVYTIMLLFMFNEPQRRLEKREEIEDWEINCSLEWCALVTLSIRARLPSSRERERAIELLFMQRHVRKRYIYACFCFCFYTVTCYTHPCNHMMKQSPESFVSIIYTKNNETYALSFKRTHMFWKIKIC